MFLNGKLVSRVGFADLFYRWENFERFGYDIFFFYSRIFKMFGEGEICRVGG